MAKEYLKMADMFDDASQEYFEQLLYSGFMSKDSCELIAHAVSSHDELVAEVERLIGENEALMKCRMAAREFFNRTVASGRLVEISSSNKHAIDEANKASDWLEAELKETAGFVNK